MTDESNAKLLQAYKYAAMADQDGIADLLGDVILELMGGEKPNMVTISNDGMTVTPYTTEPPWKVTCSTDAVPLGTTVAGTSIDHTREVVTL